jgi:hypothetical protein
MAPQGRFEVLKGVLPRLLMYSITCFCSRRLLALAVWPPAVGVLVWVAPGLRSLPAAAGGLGPWPSVSPRQKYLVPSKNQKLRLCSRLRIIFVLY